VAKSVSRSRSPLFHQRIARGGQFKKCLHIAAGVRVRLLGETLVGRLNFGFGKTAVERQSQQLPAALLRRRQLQRDLAPAEFRGRERQKDVAKDGKAAACSIAGRWSAASA